MSSDTHAVLYAAVVVFLAWLCVVCAVTLRERIARLWGRWELRRELDAVERERDRELRQWRAEW